MRWVAYAKTGLEEKIFYDSESGDLNYAISEPKLKIELSKAGTFEFTILPTHPMYNFFFKMKTYIRIMQDEYEIFRGRVFEKEDTTYMERHIRCEGDLAYLIDSLQPPQQTVGSDTTTDTTKTNATYRAQYGNHVAAKSSKIRKLDLGDVTNTSNTLKNQLIQYISHHNSQIENEKKFTVGNVTMTASGPVNFSSNNYRDTKTCIDSDLLKQYGGFLQTRKNQNGYTFLDWLKQPGVTSQQKIVLGVNLLDIQQKYESDDLFTILVPIGDSDLTIASVNNGNIGIENAAAIAKYGRIYKTQSYSGVTNASELKALGQAYMNANCKPDEISLTIKAIDMNLLDGSAESIQVGSTVTVISDPHEIEVSLTCISIEYDLQNPENNSYEIGDPSETLSQKTNSQTKEATSKTSSASRSASRANTSASTLEDTVNRHAQNIIDHADTLYKLEADLVQVHAKCIEITATEKVTVTTDDFVLNANGTITIKSKGVMTMASDAKINFNDTLYIGDCLDDYSFYTIGSAWMQQLTIGGECSAGLFTDENGGEWADGAMTGMLSVESQYFYISDGYGGRGDLADAIKSISNGYISGNSVIVNYTTFNGTGSFTIPLR